MHLCRVAPASSNCTIKSDDNIVKGRRLMLGMQWGGQAIMPFFKNFSKKSMDFLFRFRFFTIFDADISKSHAKYKVNEFTKYS